MTGARGTRVVVAGSSGLIGSVLVRVLEAEGAEVLRLVRRPAQHAGEIQWSPGEIPFDSALLAGVQTVINLNGASIGKLPWTRRYREQLLDSRLSATRTLAAAIRELGEGAPHFVSASAVGYYGDRPGEMLAENSAAGETFLARLCVDWEQAALAAGPAANVALLRTAPILHPRGVLKPLILMTKFGVSGPLGTGTQVWPWISLHDEVRAILHVVTERLGGPVNLTGPTPATASEIGRELARHMHRPYLLRAPRWALRLGLGRDAADALLLADANVAPSVLNESGFEFTHRTPREAIAAALEISDKKRG